MAIVDIRGNPIEMKQLREPQTATLAHLRRQFDAHPSKGLTPARLAAILDGASEGNIIAQHELFLDMEDKDGHIQSEMHKRKMAVAGLDWSLKPPRNASAKEQKDTAALEELLRDEIEMEAIVFDLLDAVGYGFSCLELSWSAGAVRLPSAEHKPQTWFAVDPAERNELLLRDNLNAYGSPLWPMGWIAHRHKTKSGWLPRSGLYRALAWPFLFKNYSIRDLAEFLEIYGLPLRLGKYPAGASNDEKATLMRAVMGIGHAAAGIIPEGMAIEFQTATSAGSSDPFMVQVNWCEGIVSKAILGGTLTTSTAANGNRALGEVHDEVRLDIRNSDARQLGVTLSRQLVYPIAVLNGFFEPGRVPRLEFDTQEPDDLALYADALPKLIDKGFRVPARYVYDKLKIPEPEGDEEVLQTGAPADSPAGIPGAASPAQQAALSALSAQIAAMPQADPPGEMVDLLGKTAAPHIDAMVEAVRGLLDSVSSLQEFRERLAELFPAMDKAVLAAVFAEAFTAAELAGRGDVNEGR
jgi:phage gp29-like protein